MLVGSAGTAADRAAGAEQGFVHDLADGTRAAAALGAAAEAAIDLLGVARQIFRGADGTADIMVGEDVAGTNNHEALKPSR